MAILQVSYFMMETLLEQHEFDHIMSEITLAWAKGDVEEAFAKVEIIFQNGSPEMKSQGLFLRGMIHSDQNGWNIARQDWLDAIKLTKNGTFLFHCLQDSIGKSYRMDGLDAKALAWYRDAIRTCAEGDEFACAETLLAYLELNDGTVDLEDNSIVKMAIEKSWRVLQLSGAPDLANLPQAIVNLNKGFQELQEQIKGDL